MFSESNLHPFPWPRSSALCLQPRLLPLSVQLTKLGPPGGSDLYGGTAPPRLTAAQREAGKAKRSGEGILLMSQSSQAMGCITIETLPASPPLCPGVWNRPRMLGAGLFSTKSRLLLLGVPLIKPKSCTTTHFSDYRMPRPNSVQKG